MICGHRGPEKARGSGSGKKGETLMIHYVCSECDNGIAKGEEGWENWFCPGHPKATVESVVEIPAKEALTYYIEIHGVLLQFTAEAWIRYLEERLAREDFADENLPEDRTGIEVVPSFIRVSWIESAADLKEALDMARKVG
jgi:hypothetical protein